MYLDIFSSQSKSPSVSKWVEKSNYIFEENFDDEDDADQHDDVPIIPVRAQNSPAPNAVYGENGALYKAIEKRDERIKELELSVLRFEQAKAYVLLLCY